MRQFRRQLQFFSRKTSLQQLSSLGNGEGKTACSPDHFTALDEQLDIWVFDICKGRLAVVGCLTFAKDVWWSVGLRTAS